jgi:FAD/FMN-containing dehydrogenase
MSDLEALARSLRGPVIRPADAAYDETRRTFNAMLDRRPAVIAQPLDAADVSTAVRWAAEADLPISIRCAGHSVAGHGVGTDSLMLDLAKLRTVTVDPASRVADAGGGARLEDLDRATTAHGLAAPSGTYADTGIGGLTLGGGISYLLGAAGFACDALVAAEIVTADGAIQLVDDDRDPELLWALRGGGGNFGVVTRFRFALTPMQSVYGGRITFAGGAAREIFELLFELREMAPDELTVQAVLGRNESGGLGALVIGAWIGAADQGEAMFHPFRRRSDVVVDDLGPMSYLALQSLGPGWDPHTGTIGRATS